MYLGLDCFFCSSSYWEECSSNQRKSRACLCCTWMCSLFQKCL
uniref:Uncharacterized protein n=1 Tax=Anguilla anguilla TaxID=7936 RepID=A0A0E9XHG7_ANGAN